MPVRCRVLHNQLHAAYVPAVELVKFGEVFDGVVARQETTAVPRVHGSSPMAHDLSRRFDGSFEFLERGTIRNSGAWRIRWPTQSRAKRCVSSARCPRSFPSLSNSPNFRTAADNSFLSLEAAADATGKQDLSTETLAADSSKAILMRCTSRNRSAMIWFVNICCIRITILVCGRQQSAGRQQRLHWLALARGAVRKELMMELLRHSDSCVRRAMFGASLNGLR